MEIELRDAITGLTASQIRAISAMLENRDYKTAAQSVGIPEKTIYRWLQDPEFCQAYQEILTRTAETAFNRSASTLAIASEEAVSVLREIQNDGSIAAGVRVKAAGELLGFSVRLRELQDLSMRLAAIEERMVLDG